MFSVNLDEALGLRSYGRIAKAQQVLSVSIGALPEIERTFGQSASGDATARKAFEHGAKSGFAGSAEFSEFAKPTSRAVQQCVQQGAANAAVAIST